MWRCQCKMKIPLSIKDVYNRYQAIAEDIANEIKPQLETIASDHRWYFVDRIKSCESFCQKIESGRFDLSLTEINLNNQPGDIYACSIVVNNLKQISEAIDLLKTAKFIKFCYMKPEDLSVSNNRPTEFVFDGARLYFVTIPSVKGRKDRDNMVFEIQVTTFLDYAWGFSSHDSEYKGNSFNWGVSRIMAQNKAILDSVELSLLEYLQLSQSRSVNLKNKVYQDKQALLEMIESLWDEMNIPEDKKSLINNIYKLMEIFCINQTDLLGLIKKHKSNESVSLTVYAGVVKALILEYRLDFFTKIKRYNSNKKEPYKFRLLLYKELNVDDYVHDFDSLKDQYSDFIFAL